MGIIIDGGRFYNSYTDFIIDKKKEKEKRELRKKKIKELKKFSFNFLFYTLWKKISKHN